MITISSPKYEDYRKRARQIGKRIKAEREALGLTQIELAEKIYISSYQTIGNWESGKKQKNSKERKFILPDLSDMLQLCDVFHCELGYLLCDYDCKTRTATDVKAVTGLSEEAINRISPSVAGKHIRLFTKSRDYDRKALNSILEFNGGEILSLIAEYLFTEEKPVELEDGRILTAETISTSYLLEISGELQALKKKIGGDQSGDN